MPPVMTCFLLLVVVTHTYLLLLCMYARTTSNIIHITVATTSMHTVCIETPPTLVCILASSSSSYIMHNIIYSTSS